MTKKFFGGLVFLALAAGGFAMQGNSSKTALSPLQMENLEALSDNENTSGNCWWLRVNDDYGCVYHRCDPNGDGASCYPCGTVTLH